MKIELLRTNFSRHYCLSSLDKGYLEETELLLKHERWTIFKPGSIVGYGANFSCVLLAPSKLICCFLCSLNIIPKVIREVMYEENFIKKRWSKKFKLKPGAFCSRFLSIYYSALFYECFFLNAVQKVFKFLNRLLVKRYSRMCKLNCSYKTIPIKDHLLHQFVSISTNCY